MPFKPFSQNLLPDSSPVTSTVTEQNVNEFGNVVARRVLRDNCDLSNAPHYRDFDLDKMLDSGQPLKRVSIDPIVGEFNDIPTTIEKNNDSNNDSNND